ncbi:type IV pilin-like G/H family protein [Coleofasciculus sp. FACHB-1120]|uniref:type IV pilin-like G/H family protein n=1 Tax=Coleofasciculus sp. FACHB-1120 TaxID=2692783 RepID=UPI0016893EAA|nr:type IV pilin-like G/H family protein [Coleofasciculus sp. FACHB-1120]
MNTTVFKQRSLHPGFQMLSGLLGLLAIYGCNSTNTPSVSSSPSPAKDNSGADRWVGQWQVNNPSSSQALKFVLTPEGKLFLLPPETSSESSVAYEIPVQKLSDSPTLPPNTKIVDIQEAFNNQATKAKQSEGKTYIGAMNRAQQAYYLENNKFGTTIEQLGVGIKLETESYNYKIVPQGNGTQSVMHTAKAKRPELNSYTGAVFVVTNNGENITRTAICETDKPSSTAPAMPTPPKDISGQIQCPAGSHLLGR